MTAFCMLILFTYIYLTISVHTNVQIKQLNVPIKVKIYEWNASGLLSRIEVRPHEYMYNNTWFSFVILYLNRISLLRAFGHSFPSLR